MGASNVKEDLPDTTTIDLPALRDRRRATWSSGDYAVVGTTLRIIGEEFCEALDLRSGQKVLDVAAGNGNAPRAAGAMLYRPIMFRDCWSSVSGVQRLKG